ncbi:plasmid partitioning protein [Izhakiella australiensis]|uniref:Plasmid partitioning protein n=1 Tax=Izhakiella australiensis TaxID=1926881 RepID=A0A1S8Y6C7_9GAMM|nr:plasmid partitioning protein RepB C-terminal domain-containing protein [Izhakiella australiensis]OON34651.1 plasmid partitioning protein [Izhakiella australiensis]
MIKCCFSENTLSLNISELLPTKKLLINYESSEKFLQIKCTLKSIGLIEPILVYIDSVTNEIKILDGHMRIEALKELGETKVECLVSTIYDTYTPNKKVNQVTIIQIQKMLKEAIKAGVPIELLSASLNISVDSLKGRISVLDGISPQVVEILNDKVVPKATFLALKKMVPLRQLECANLMIRFDNFSKNFSHSLLQSSPKETLIESKNTKGNHKTAQRKMIDRLEKEMAHVHVDADKLKENYGSTSLKLTIVISHIKTLLENQALFRWLHKHKPELLNELIKISEIRSLN